RRHEFGKVAGHWPLVAAADLHLVAVAEDDRTEAVPLRLVRGAGRDGLHRLRQHRRDGRHDRQFHAVILGVAAPPAVERRGRLSSGWRKPKTWMDPFQTRPGCRLFGVPAPWRR